MNILEPVGHIITPFSQKFGIPRQGAGLSIAKGEVKFSTNIKVAEACEGLEQFSHLWLVFQFHENAEKGWSSKVRPPRLGGNDKLGVFATRSSFRPNGIGMSVVKLISVNKNSISVEGVDMLSGTPILDIKPYIAYADSLPNAQCSYAQESPSLPLKLIYSTQADAQLQIFVQQYSDLASLIELCLCSDPRPAYKKHKNDEKQYHIRLYDIDIHFTVEQNQVTVHVLEKVNPL